MTEREQLREEIARGVWEQKAALYDWPQPWENAPGGEITNKADAYRSADAVLAVLDQQGWVSPAEASEMAENAYARGYNAASTAIVAIGAERDAALREAARYEPIPDTMHRVDCPWTIWNFGPDVFSSDVPDDGPDCDCESDIYRRVTEGGEG